MRIGILLVSLLIGSVCFAHFKPNPKGFLVTYQKGINWNASKVYKKQNKMGDHVFYLRQLYHDGKLLLGANKESDKLGVYIFKGDNLKEVQKTINNDPAIKNKVLQFEIEAL
ncbi:MAG: YciI family protein, partial [Pseudomonadota bacterium]